MAAADEARKELARRELAKRQGGAPQPAPAPEPISQFESAKQGLAQGVSFGFADEASGGIGAITDTVTSFINGDLEWGDFTESYRQRVGEARDAVSAAQEANPKTFMAGQAGGAIASGLATGGAGAIGKGLGAATKLGAGLGAAAAAGASEADLTRGEVGELAEDALLGSAIGAVTGVGGELVGKALGATGRFVGQSQIGQKLRQVASNVISPKGAAASLAKEARASGKKAFSQVENKNLESGIAGLQKRGVIPSERDTFLATSRKELSQAVKGERQTLGKSIENLATLADESGVDFGSNKLGLNNLRKVTKEIRKGSTADEFNVALDEVSDRLTNESFKATDLAGIKQELDNVIRVGNKLGSLKKSQSKTLMGVRKQVKEALESKIDEAAANNPQMQQELNSHGMKKFADLNDAFSDTIQVDRVLDDAVALADEAAGRLEVGSLADQISDLTRMEGVVSAITGGAGKLVGKAAEGVTKKAGPALGAAGRGIGATARAAARREKESALVARTIYQSIDEDNIINDEGERQAHVSRIMRNSTLPHSQKFREINMMQTTGKMNPESIPARDKKQILKEIDAENRALQEEVMNQLRGL